jgi:hypothetical protein
VGQRTRVTNDWPSTCSRHTESRQVGMRDGRR